MYRTVFLVGLISALAASASATAQLYKWTDEKGVVHYGDRIPPEYINRGSTELNARGVPLRKTAPALTAEQRKAIEDEKEKHKSLSKQEAEQKRKDEALLASYMNETEIEQAKQRNLATIEGVIKGSESRLAELAKRKQEIESSSSIQGYQQKELASIITETSVLKELVEQKRKEAATLAAKYDAERQRFREIKNRERLEKQASIKDR